TIRVRYLFREQKQMSQISRYVFAFAYRAAPDRPLFRRPDRASESLFLMLVELRRERVQLAVQRLLARFPIVRAVGTSRAVGAAVGAMVVAVLAARPAALRARSAQLGGARGLFHGQ